MLPVETLKELTKTIQAANPQARIVKAPQEPDHVYHILTADGAYERVEAMRKPDHCDVSDLATLARLANDVEHDDDSDAPEAWYTRRAVAIVSGRNRYTLDLEPSPQLAAIIALEKQGGGIIDQAGFVKQLRTTFADCYPAHPKLLECVRKLKTTRAAEVNSEIQKGKVSMGRTAVAEMSGIELIPEEVTFSVPVFAAAALWVKAGVRVCVEPDPEKERFALTVIPGQIEAAWAAGEMWIRAKLEGELSEAGAKEVPVYFGSP